MRGKDTETFAVADLLGITPAYAGKRSKVYRCICGDRDHPRLCGEKPAYLLQRSRLQGSPPPMRGKAALPAVPLRRSGITPAYAGKRKAHWTREDVTRDHPRLCGEK